MPPNKDTSATKSRVGANGRPRLTDSASSKPLSAKRRSQLRQSQKTYREKKEAAIQHHQRCAEQLETKVSKLHVLFSELHRSAQQTQLNILYPDLYAQIYGIRQFLEPQEDARPAGTLRLENESNPVEESTDEMQSQQEDRRQSSKDTYISNILEVSPPSSYTHNESNFGRRLQRFCLEYAYGLCLDTRTDPSVLYRHFRLAPCAKDLKKTMPAFRQLVRAGLGEKLEFTNQSFYCIGGAASHYPHFDSDGNRHSPPNVRMPKRLIGLHAHVDITEEMYKERLALYGFHGEWFDCQDVYGYLREKGFAQENADTFKRQASRNNDGRDYEVNISAFFSGLLRGFAMLGRAPGFKRTEVETAFRNALTRLPRISAS